MQLITVKGEYYHHDGYKKILKDYTETFEIPDNEVEMAIATIQNELITPRLKERDACAQRYRTCAIVSVKKKGGGKATEDTFAQKTKKPKVKTVPAADPKAQADKLAQDLES